MLIVVVVVGILRIKVTHPLCYCCSRIVSQGENILPEIDYVGSVF